MTWSCSRTLIAHDTRAPGIYVLPCIVMWRSPKFSNNIEMQWACASAAMVRHLVLLVREYRSIGKEDFRLRSG